MELAQNRWNEIQNRTGDPTNEATISRSAIIASVLLIVLIVFLSGRLQYAETLLSNSTAKNKNPKRILPIRSAKLKTG